MADSTYEVTLGEWDDERRGWAFDLARAKGITVPELRTAAGVVARPSLDRDAGFVLWPNANDPPGDPSLRAVVCVADTPLGPPKRALSKGAVAIYTALIAAVAAVIGSIATAYASRCPTDLNECNKAKGEAEVAAIEARRNSAMLERMFAELSKSGSPAK